eukprot:3726581-Rhodomonas_salina.2
MLSCVSRGPGAAALAVRRGFVEARDCEVRGSTAAAVEVREGGRYRLQRCSIWDCKPSWLWRTARCSGVAI